MAKYNHKKRLDIMVEAPMMRTITDTLDRARVPGYSVLPIIEGRGIDNSWNSQGQITDTTNMIALLCIVDESQAEEVVDVVFSAIQNRIGFLTVSDVYLVGPDRS